jgi:multidrug efflux pump subunit AcrB
MISGIFIDRPRFAVVIALIITLAGLLALVRIPVAQFPNIVPCRGRSRRPTPAPLLP